MENKLTIKELAPYLPYGLKISVAKIYEGFECDLVVNNPTNSLKNGMDINTAIDSDVKPLLRPLSDLTNEIEHNGEKFVFSDLYFTNNKIIKAQNPSNCLFNNMLNDLDYNSIQLLLRYHFDVFGLIKRGLALPINKS